MQQLLSLFIISCAGLSLLIGGLALSQQPHKSAHQWFFSTTVFCALWILSLQLGFSFTETESLETANRWFRIAHGAGIAGITCLTQFLRNYPEHPQPSWRNTLYLAASVALAVIASSTPLVYDSVVIHSDSSLSDILGPLFGLFILHTLSSELFAIWLSWKKITQSTGLVRRKLQFCFIGITLFTASAFLTNGILPVFDIYLFQKEAPLFSLFFLIPSFYSLYYNRFFQLSTQSLNLSRSCLLTLSFIIAAITSYSLISLSLGNFQNLSVIIGSALIGLFTYISLWKRFPEMLSESEKQLREHLLILQGSLYSCNSFESLNSALQQHFEVQLNFGHTQLFCIRNSHPRIPCYRPDKLTDYISFKHASVLIQEELQAASETQAYAKVMRKKQMAMLLPLYFERELIGLLSFGPRSDKGYYGLEEIELLVNWKKHLETCFMNVLLESGLRKEKSLVEQSLETRTKRIREQHNRTKQLLQHHEEYLSYAAHELKNPLHTLMMQLEVSLAELNQQEQTQQDLRHIETSAKQLQRLTMNLFDTQQVELNKSTLQLSPVSMSELVKEVSFEFQAAMQDRQLLFTLDNRLPQALELQADAIKLRQVLHNLLHNAMKFTPAGGQVELSAELQDEQIQLSVSDTGCGIPADRRVQIFDKFAHGEQQHGLGVGLYLSKAFVELHKGSLQVEDNSPQGSRFIIRLNKTIPKAVVL